MHAFPGIKLDGRTPDNRLWSPYGLRPSGATISISVAARETSLWEGRGAKSTTQKCQFAMEIRPVAGVDALKRRAQYSVLSEYNMNKSAAAQ